MTSSSFTLREMQPSDSGAVAGLMTEDGDSAITTHFLLDSYTVLTQADQHKTVVMVAEAPNADGLAGLATVSFGQVQFEGELLPFASLDSWQVAQRFRKQGLASHLVQATIDYAEAEYGKDIVLRSGLASDNDASRATARKWCREFFEPIQARISPVRKRPAPKMAGVVVREAQASDYAAIVQQQNAFYADYNLYEPLTVESLAAILAHAPSGECSFHYWIAETNSGDLLAGALLRRRGLLMVDRINMRKMPLPLRLGNLLVRIVPADNTLREIGVDGLWYAPGQVAAAKHFWKSLRWDLRSMGTSLSIAYDPRSPLAQVFESKSPLEPSFQIAFAIRGPVPMSPDRFVATTSRR